jgi:two-component system, LytTR family, response regulator
VVIFTTAYPQYALDGYEHGVLDYLLKPVSPGRLQQACRKALEWREFYFRAGEEAGYFYLKSDGITGRIAYEEVLYIEGANNYVYVHTTQKKLMAYLTLKGIERQLPPERFIRVHKSFIVARDRIDRIEGSRLIVGGRSIPLSRRFRQEFRDGVLGSKQWSR